MRRYKDTFVAKGSALLEAMEMKDGKKLAEKIYKETTARAKALYGEDYDWFMAFNKQDK